jgi:hypothetical protein
MNVEESISAPIHADIGSLHKLALKAAEIFCGDRASRRIAIDWHETIRL